jgi:hypothetical protein
MNSKNYYLDSIGIRVKGFSDFILEDYESPDFSSGIDKNMEEDAKIKIKRAILWINNKKGFFGELLLKLDVYGSTSPRYKTMCTNGFSIMYHPEFVLTQSEPAVRFVLCHEILHCLAKHFSRRESRNPTIWNVACDLAINPILNYEVISEVFDWPKNPDGSRMGLYEEKYEGMSAEEIYNKIMEDPEELKKYESDPQDMGNVEDSGTDLPPPDSPDSVVNKAGGGSSGGNPPSEGPEIYGQPGSIIGIKQGPYRGYAKIVSINEVTGEHEIIPLTREEATKELAKNR